MAGKGKPKTGGRKKGVPNKDTRELLEICQDLGFSPFEALIEIAETSIEEGNRLQALKEICSYLYPKRKAIEHSNKDEEGFRVIIQDYLSPGDK